MSTEEKLRARFRAFAEQNFICGVLKPRGLNTRCELPFGHAGRHSWYEPTYDEPCFDFDEADDPQVQASPVISFGTWTKVEGEWFVRARVNAKAGDLADVKSKDGQITRVVLGEKIGRNVFRWYSQQEVGSDGRA